MIASSESKDGEARLASLKDKNGHSSSMTASAESKDDVEKHASHCERKRMVIHLF